MFGEKFTDNTFPTNFNSIGTDQPAKWIRVSDMNTIIKSESKSANVIANSNEYEQVNNDSTIENNIETSKNNISNEIKEFVLFNDVLIPYEICKLASANSFILSALVMLCENPSFLQNIFINRAFNPRGKYKFHLYDIEKNVLKKVIIDDYIPINDDGNPIFMKMAGNQV